MKFWVVFICIMRITRASFEAVPTFSPSLTRRIFLPLPDFQAAEGLTYHGTEGLKEVNKPYNLVAYHYSMVFICIMRITRASFEAAPTFSRAPKEGFEKSLRRATIMLAMIPRGLRRATTPLNQSWIIIEWESQEHLLKPSRPFLPVHGLLAVGQFAVGQFAVKENC